MPQRYLQSIVKYLSGANYQPLKLSQLARQMGVGDEHYPPFREAVKQLRDGGRVVLGPKNSLSLPAMGGKVVGVYRANPRGFGFVVPQERNAHGDLFIPEGQAGGAMTGDTVVATAKQRGRREGRDIFQGRIVEILERGKNRFVGELKRAEGVWFVVPQGNAFTAPIVIDDIGPAAKEGAKVVVEIAHYAEGTDMARGVIVETLGAAGPIDVETQAVIRAQGLADTFTEQALADARSATEAFERELGSRPPTPREAGQQPHGRMDLTQLTTVTIDPDDARDFDDAISLEQLGRHWRLGVHIADVSHFVVEGTTLDAEARERGNSVYFPRRVVPMLPELLSNGVCSLQEGQPRYVKTAFIDYDDQGNVVGASFANGLIRSAKRLTYLQAQGILDGRIGGYLPAVVELVRRTEMLARIIEKRRRAAGMLHLDLPEVELVLSDDGRVIDAVAADESYTHTIIEMFMVEGNEAVARLLDSADVPFLRRVHPEGDVEGNKHLHEFIRACGVKVPKTLSRSDMQALVEAVRGRPESYAVNRALLKMLESAEYSPARVGHFALASDQYCHFTSPIRRYPDLTVHRLLDTYLQAGGGKQGVEALRREHPPGAGGLPRGGPLREGEATNLTRLGEHFSYTERRAQRAEEELRTLLVLQMLVSHVGETFEGVVTGVTSFGLFVQSAKYLVEGLVRLEDLGDDWWDVRPNMGTVVGQRSGRRIRMGDIVTAQIVAVDLARRQLNLHLPAPAGAEKAPKRKPGQDQPPQGQPAQGQPPGRKAQPGRRRRKGKQAKAAASPVQPCLTPPGQAKARKSRRRRRR